jgi:hypothetical protein
VNIINKFIRNIFCQKYIETSITKETENFFATEFGQVSEEIVVGFPSTETFNEDEFGVTIFPEFETGKNETFICGYDSGVTDSS